MVELVQMGGPLTIPILLIGMVVSVLFLGSVVFLLASPRQASRAARSGLWAFPVLGVTALVIGVAATVDSFLKVHTTLETTALTPGAIAVARREYAVPSLLGLTVCALAVASWAGLRSFHRLREVPVPTWDGATGDIRLPRRRPLEGFRLRFSSLSRRVKATLAIAGAGLLVVLYIGAYRPWSLSWGATAAERARVMPGDEIVPDPEFNATRAVTIASPPEDIWPWLVQMGYLRAGFYSWDILDNAGVPSSEEILPTYQGLAVGDRVPLSAQLDATVRALEPNRFLVLEVPRWERAHEPWTWVWVLYPVDASHTRLVSRLRVRPGGRQHRFMLDNLEIIMMRKCMLGIKRRAERSR